MGGCLAWNSIYREFREDTVAVDTWTLELLCCLVSCLALAHTDPHALGTHTQATTALSHIERIIKFKKELFWKNSNIRRVPNGFDDGNLDGALKWLLNQCGQPQQLARHTCMQLMVSLATHSKGCTSIHTWIEKQKSNVKSLVDIVEGGGEAGTGLKHLKLPTHQNYPHLSLQHLITFFEALLAALDGYCWLIGQGISRSKDLLGHPKVKVLLAAKFFTENIATESLFKYLASSENSQQKMTPGSLESGKSDVIPMELTTGPEKSSVTPMERAKGGRNFGKSLATSVEQSKWSGKSSTPFTELIEGSKNSVASPIELSKANKLKCTVVIRVLDFFGVILQDGKSVAEFLDYLWTPKLCDMVTRCTLDPMGIGFDVMDTEVTKHLPLRLAEILEIMHRKLGHKSQDFTRHLEALKIDIRGMLPTTPSSSLQSRHAIEGLGVLFKSGWLESVVQKSTGTELVLWVCDILFTNVDGKLQPRALQPTQLPFIYAVLDLSVMISEEARELLLQQATDTTLITGSMGQPGNRGSHIYHTLSTHLLPHLLKTPDALLARIKALIQAKKFPTAINIASSILATLIKNRDLRQTYSRSLVQAFLYHWPTFYEESKQSSLNCESVLSLLSSLFLVDQDGALRKHCLAENGVLAFYKELLCDIKVEFQLKIRALSMLAFFLTVPEISTEITEALEILSAKHIPLQSTEFPLGGSRDQEHQQALESLLSALSLTASPVLVAFISKLYCREETHRYDTQLQDSLEKLTKVHGPQKQQQILKEIYTCFCCHPGENYRQNLVTKFLMPLMQLCDLRSAEVFFVDVISEVMGFVVTGIQGKSDVQESNLVNKTTAYMILQVLYSRLPKEKVFAAGSVINNVYRPADSTGKELTKEVFRYAAKTAKGELRHDQTHRELRRICACAAYNTLIAVLVCVQNDIRFYTNFLFNANPTKGEAIWETLIDCNKSYAFDIEVNFNPSSKRRFVAVRSSTCNSRKEEGMLLSSTVQYLASHYLSDSSLSLDISQFDFNNSVVLAIEEQGGGGRKIEGGGGEKGLEVERGGGRLEGERGAGDKMDGGELVSLNLEQSDFNEHEIMANLTAVINHMVNEQILSQPKQGSTSDVPQFIVSMQQKLENIETPRNVKLFLLRLMTNTEHVFGHYAGHLLPVILTCMVDGTLGDNINYFFCDLLVMILNWGKEAVPPDSALGRNLSTRVLKFLCTHTPHNRADIFKYNIDVVRSVVESWRTVLTVPYPVIYSLMEIQKGSNREVEAGLQLLGIILANELPPFSSEKVRCERLVVNLLTNHYASVYGAAAEVAGLILKYHSRSHPSESLGGVGEDRGHPSQSIEQGSTFEDTIVRKILDLIHQNSGHAITCIYNIQKHYAPILTRFINKLLNILPKLYGLMRTRVLECLANHSAQMEDVFTHLKEQNILETLARKEAETQLVSLNLVNSVMPRLSPIQLLYFIPSVVNFVGHPAPKIRELMYDVLFWVYDNFNDDLSTEGRKLEQEARVTLLRGVIEEDAALRQQVLNFWFHRFPQSLPDRLIYILETLYSPESENSFLYLSSYLLLEGTANSADFHREIFSQPLSLCRFREMRVSTTWRARHSSMIPLFAETQTSDSPSSLISYLNMTQGDTEEFEGRVEATQANVFSATQGPSNWLQDSTFDTTLADMEATITPQAPTSGLLFTTKKSSSDMRRYKQASIGTSRMEPPKDTPDSGAHERLLRRRFVRNQDREKQTIFFAKMEERRGRLRGDIERERKARREAQVTMYRQYRVGELPDVQIPHKALIAPLQALAQREGSVARLVLEGVIGGVVKVTENIIQDVEAWKARLKAAIDNIVVQSQLYHPEVLRTAIHIAIENDIKLTADTLTAACFGSRLESLGILALERQIMIAERDQREQEPPRKRAKVTKETGLGGTGVPGVSADIWLNLAELYKSLGMWDVVRGILRSHLGDIKPDTKLALESEATRDHVNAFVHYQSALQSDWAEGRQAEVRVIEEWFSSCAAQLGQWGKLENFVETRFLTDSGEVNLEKVWSLPRPASVLSSLINSKLMLILEGTDDRNLCKFIDNALAQPDHRALLEGELPLQLGVLSAYQERIPQAQSYLSSATQATLLTLAQYTLLTPKPLLSTLRNVQLLNEFRDFLGVLSFAESETYVPRVRECMLKWGTQMVNSDSPLLLQLLSSYRTLYLHFLKLKLNDSVTLELIKQANLITHRAVVGAALTQNNYQLAIKHLKKFKTFCSNNSELSDFYFLMTEAYILRGKGKHTLQYLVEAWSKYLGKIDSLKVLGDSQIEIKYLKLESKVCINICECIKEMEGWSEENAYMKILADKFPEAQGKEGWFEEMLGCSFRCLKKAVDIIEHKSMENLGKYKEGVSKFSELSEKCSEGGQYSGGPSHSKGLLNPVQKLSPDIYMTLAKYTEDCIENWSPSIDLNEYNKTLISSVLKAMSLGSSEAHYHFPRLINLMEGDTCLIMTFKSACVSVPPWMYLLWLSHILIYVDKPSGPALQPIVEELAHQYPQALAYPFRISVRQYDFTSSVGRAAQCMSVRVEHILSQNPLLTQFISDISLLVAPYLSCKDEISALFEKEEKELIERGLRTILEEFLMERGSGVKEGERSGGGFGSGVMKGEKDLSGKKGTAHTKLCSIRKAALENINKHFGTNLQNFKDQSISQITSILKAIRNKMKHNENYINRELPRDLKSYSPWLAKFHSSNHPYILELPGQYTGLAKPMPEYHIKIHSFGEQVMPIKSLRIPYRLVIHGDDYSEQKFLVKCGEDLRTDQRIQQLFSLMNSLYKNSSIISQAPKPSLDVYQVTPLSLEVGILKWVDHTETLKAFMLDSLTEHETKSYNDIFKSYCDAKSWDIKKMYEREGIVKEFESTVNKIPWDILRRALMKLASSKEGFFALRSAFTVSYATLSISHWLLGIGDRHCGNFLVSLQSGRLIGIDFGHHFETSVQFLGTPELMPFRLTPQICNIFKPLGHKAILKDMMVAILKTLQDSSQILLSVLEAFVKEPTQDFLYFIKVKEGSTDDAKVELFSNHRMQLLRAKLSGINPGQVTKWAVSENRAVKNDKQAVQFLEKVILGTKGQNTRADFGKRNLSPHQQVDILLDQATDPNILGRTWGGWEPFL